MTREEFHSSGPASNSPNPLMVAANKSASIEPESQNIERVIRVLHEDIGSLKIALQEKDELLNTARMQLAQAGKMNTLGSLGAGVAHELNNPLTIILGEAEEILYTIEAGCNENSLTAVSAERIIHAADRMRQIVDHIRRFIRKDEDTPWQRINVNDLINESLFILKSQLQSRGIILELALAEDLPSIWGHPVKLETVFQNLLTNARDAFDKIGDAREKKISIKTTFSAAETLIISVKDNGPGMSDQVKAQVFELFFTTKENLHGTGLGLAMSLGYIKEHRGLIEVQSREQEGATFTVTLPLEKRTRTATQEVT